MKLSNKFLAILLLINCQFAFAGTGSAKDGYSIIFVLAGILVLIFGTPYLIRNSKRVWHMIKHTIERHFNPIKTKGGKIKNLKIVY